MKKLIVVLIIVFGWSGVCLGANFYPATVLTGGGTGALDKITTPGDKDVAIVTLEADATYGNACFIYVFNTGGTESDDRLPYVVQPDDTTTGDWVLANIWATNVIGGIKLTSDTAATVALTAPDVWGAVRINGDDDVIDYTLPDASPATGSLIGANVCFYSPYARVVTIDAADTNDTIYLDGDSIGAGDALDSPGTTGDYICLLCTAAGQWHSFGRSGTWVDGGAD